MGVILQGIRGFRAGERDLAFLLREFHQLTSGGGMGRASWGKTMRKAGESIAFEFIEAKGKALVLSVKAGAIRCGCSYASPSRESIRYVQQIEKCIGCGQTQTPLRRTFEALQPIPTPARSMSPVSDMFS